MFPFTYQVETIVHLSIRPPFCWKSCCFMATDHTVGECTLELPTMALMCKLHLVEL